jgi:hypothetical protein
MPVQQGTDSGCDNWFPFFSCVFALTGGSAGATSTGRKKERCCKASGCAVNLRSLGKAYCLKKGEHPASNQQLTEINIKCPLNLVIWMPCCPQLLWFSAKQWLTVYTVRSDID